MLSYQTIHRSEAVHQNGTLHFDKRNLVQQREQNQQNQTTKISVIKMSESGGSMRRRTLLNGLSHKEDTDEDALMSLEKLDRASPDLWPEKIPGITDFIAMSETPIHTSSPTWSKGLSQDDINAMHELGVLSTNGLIMEIKKLYDEAYQLGVVEAKEMTRGKYLGIFNNAKKKSQP